MTLLNALPFIVMLGMVLVTFRMALQLHKSSKSQAWFYFFWLRLNDTAMRPKSMQEAFPECDPHLLHSYRKTMLIFFLVFMLSVFGLMALSVYRS